MKIKKYSNPFKNPRFIKSILVFLLLLLGSVWGLDQADVVEVEKILGELEERQPGTYQVLHVNDGDTITINMNGVTEEVRFIGVDTPETQHPEKPVQCFGRVATQFTEELIGNYSVRLEADPRDDNRDIYNRLLRYVYLPDGTMLNRELVSQGYGFAYTRFPFRYLEEFRALEKQAREDRLGLWSSCDLQENQFGQIETAPE